MANTSAIWQQDANTTSYQLSSPSCSTRAIQKKKKRKKSKKKEKRKAQLLTKNVCICVTGLSPLISELAQHIKLMLSQCRDQRTVSRLE